MDKDLINDTVVEHESENWGKVYWHDAFFAALQLELDDYADSLIFENEHQLSKEALEIDVLVIKKTTDAPINKNVGRIFKGHNLFEITMVGLIQTHHRYFNTNKPHNHRNKGFRGTGYQQREPFYFLLFTLSSRPCRTPCGKCKIEILHPPHRNLRRYRQKVRLSLKCSNHNT
ncbi:MAG: hypothetical protein FWF77_06915 [Defluviitaleaceae bacterium]|nr:hypothetical protein [Defluviitaleaceae bacterium]